MKSEKEVLGPSTIIASFSLLFSRLKVYRRSAILLDTGYIIHNDIKGGQLGPYSFSQSGMIWSDVKVTCNGESLACNDFHKVCRINL